MMITEEPTVLSVLDRAHVRHRRKPSRRFADLIEEFWILPKHLGTRQRVLEILPDGNFDLAFLLADSCCKLFLAGPYTERICVPMEDSCELFCVRFRPGRMPRLADVKPAEIVNGGIEISRMLGTHVDGLGEHLHASKGIDSKQRIIEDMFRDATLESVIRNGPCSRSAQLVESCRGRIKVRDVARLLGMSNRTLERLFIDQVGISPKRFIRLVRFQSAVDKLRRGAYQTLAALAYDCGYADQSHFIRDFKELSGRLPSNI